MVFNIELNLLNVNPYDLTLLSKYLAIMIHQGGEILILLFQLNRLQS